MVFRHLPTCPQVNWKQHMKKNIDLGWILKSLNELIRTDFPAADMLKWWRKKTCGTIKCPVSSVWAMAATCPILCSDLQKMFGWCLWTNQLSSDWQQWLYVDSSWVGQKASTSVIPHPSADPCRQPKLCYFTVTFWVHSAAAVAAAAQLAVEETSAKWPRWNRFP